MRPYDRGLSAAAVLALAMLLLPALAGCSGNQASATSIDHAPADQLRFGVQMAQRGLWNEALFRFEKARDADPGNPRILNNIAVALEAAGRYDEAMEAYREAIRLAPGNRGLENNYARFVDFYQSFQRDEAPSALDALQGSGTEAGTEEGAEEDDSP
jgi:Tfp pilus assembly protein PilF